MNSAHCGINGNCICPRYFYGPRCETQIPKAKQVKMREIGIGQGAVFIICFVYLVILPFLLYIMYALLMRLMSETEENRTWGETLTDALFLTDCFKKKNEPKMEFNHIKNPNVDNELPRNE